VPTFNWKKPKFTDYREKRLDYILIFAEKPVVEPKNLLKLHPKKKHLVPAPNSYELTRDWAFKSGKDYEQ